MISPSDHNPAEVWSRNPFYILELPTDCSRMEVERQGQKWLGMLALGLREAVAYRTPLGAEERTEELVRWAMAELRDPDRRIGHELWACLPCEASGAAKMTPADGGPNEAAWFLFRMHGGR